MKVLAFNGSPRKKGNTKQLIDLVLEPLIAHGYDFEIVQVGGVLLHGCKACTACRTEKSKGICIQKDDPMNEWIEKMREADIILMGSPTYFANMTPELKCLIDRAGYCTTGELAHKIGAPITVERRGGAMNVYNGIMAFYGITQMIVPMSSYWNLGVGRAQGEVWDDEEGIATMKTLGNNILWLAEKIKDK